MQEQFDVSLPPGFTVPQNKESLTTGLGQLFNRQEAALPALVSALQYENKPKFGPSAISNLRFEVVAYHPAASNGRLRVLYDMQLTFGCEDVTKTHTDQHSYYNFKFNPGQPLLHFEGDASDALSTADEF